jgi:hypothetical protein
MIGVDNLLLPQLSPMAGLCSLAPRRAKSRGGINPSASPASTRTWRSPAYHAGFSGMQALSFR